MAIQAVARTPKQLGGLCTYSWSRSCGGASAVYTAAVQPQVDVTLSALLGQPTEQGTYQSYNQQQSHRLQDVQATAALRQAAGFKRQQSVAAPSKLQGFDDPQLAFSAKSTAQLLQSLAVFRTCSVKPFVQNADSLLAAAKTLVGPSLVTSVVRNTFFKQFCGGECEQTLKPTADMLRLHGISPILNFAAEDDVSHSASEAQCAVSCGERASDGNLQPFLRSINIVGQRGGKGFVQAKVTGLGNCDMMKQMSAHFCSISRVTAYHVEDLRSCMAAVLSPAHLQLFDNMMQRMETLVQAAASQGNVRVLIDAEHSYMQPAIDAVVLHLQAKYNKQTPIVYNTYQCYLKDSCSRLTADMQWAEEQGFLLAAKVVRGAYMHLERDRAAEMGYSSPIHDTLQDTHDNYNRCVKELMKGVKHSNFEMMVASHNQESVEAAVSLMQDLGMHPTHGGVQFGQLMGMADHLTYTLGANGYQAYKAVPYGPVEATIAYLLRRAKENSDMLGGVGKETAMLKSELWRRIKYNNPVTQFFRQQPSEAVLAGAV